MGLASLLIYPDDRLREKAQLVSRVTPQIHRLVQEMWETLKAFQGVGMAAPQIGVLKQVFITDCRVAGVDDIPRVYLNPILKDCVGEWEDEETSPTFKFKNFRVKRFERITVEAMDLSGKLFTLTPEPASLLCRAIQHEYDHLQGVLLCDRGEEGPPQT